MVALYLSALSGAVPEECHYIICSDAWSHKLQCPEAYPLQLHRQTLRTPERNSRVSAYDSEK